MSRGCPAASTINHRVQVPCVFALRASSVYSGSGVESSCGDEIPPPTLYTPPPMPPPLPRPVPGPCPTPAPPSEPDPMPPPEPIPLEGGAAGIGAAVGGQVRHVISRNLSGRRNPVRSAVSLGCWL